MKRLITLIMVLAAVSGCMSSGPVQLSLNLEKGAVYGMNTEASSTVTSAPPVNVTSTLKGAIFFRVEEADADGYEMSVWYEKLAMKMNGPSEMGGDSENTAAGDPLSIALKAMTGKPFTIRMSRSGKIVSIEGTEAVLDAVVDEMREQFPPEADESGVEFMRNSLANFYGGDAFKSNIESGMVVFSDKPVSKGDSWSSHTSTPGRFTLDIERVFTVMDINKNGITIKSEAVLDTDPDTTPDGVDVQYDLHGTMTSETVLDPVSGWIVSGKITQKVSGEMKILPGAQEPDGFSVPLDMKNDMTITGSISK